MSEEYYPLIKNTNRTGDTEEILYFAEGLRIINVVKHTKPKNYRDFGGECGKENR